MSHLSFTGQPTPRVQLNQIKKPTLRLGSTHPDVAELQKLLGRYVFPKVSSNVFDSLTDYAVRLFQYRMFLQEDGIVGPQTWVALYVGAPTNMPTLALGSRNSAVPLLQKVLSNAGFVTVVDGVFGGNTVRSLSRFQQHMNLKTDAIAGSRTWHALSKTRPEDSTRTITRLTLFSNEKRHAGPITDLSVANLRRRPTSDYGVATASLDTTVRLWTTYGLPIGTPYAGDTGSVSTVAFHPTRQQYISGTNGGTVRVTRFPDITERIFPARGGGVDSLAVDPKGRYIATGTGDGAVRLFSLDGDLIRELSAASENERIEDIAISPRDGQLAIASRHGVTIWQNPLASQGSANKLPGVSEASTVCFSPNGFRMAAAYGKSLVVFGNRGHFISGNEYSAGISSLAFNISGRYLAIGCRDGKVYVQDILRQPELESPFFELSGHEDVVSAVRFQGGDANAFSLQPEDLLYTTDRSGRLITWRISDNLSDIG